MVPGRSKAFNSVGGGVYAAIDYANPKPLWHHFVDEARLAIEAMRQPTEAMEIVAGRDNVAGDHGDPRSTWVLMIDEALR